MPDGRKDTDSGGKAQDLQICHSHGSIKIDQTKIVPGGIKIEGAIPAVILYISPEDTMPFAVLEGTIPFSHVAEVPGITRDCRFTLNAGLDQLQAAMADSEEIELKASVSLEIFRGFAHTQRCIQRSGRESTIRQFWKLYRGLQVIWCRKRDTLWGIAKQYYMTPQQIMEMNSLETQELHREYV